MLVLLNGGHHWMGLGFHNEYNIGKWIGDLADYKDLWDGYGSTTQASHCWHVTGAGSGDVDYNAGPARATGLTSTSDQQTLLNWLVTAHTILCGTLMTRLTCR